MRGRRLMLVGAVLVAVAAAVTTVALVANPGPDVTEFERVLDVEVPGGVTGIAIGGDTVYVASPSEVTAYRMGQDGPLWTFTGDLAADVDLAVLGGVLVVMADCLQQCGPLIGIDTASGSGLWNVDVPSDTLIGWADGYAAFQLTEGQFLTDAVGVNLGSGDITWRVGGTEGHDRFSVTDGTAEVVHYSHAGELRRFDLATGDPVVEVDVPPYRDGTTEMYASADEVVLQISPQSGSLTSVVYDRADLGERWSKETRVHPVDAGTLFVSTADGGEIVDGDGKAKWRTRTDIFLGARGAAWGFGTLYTDSDTEYVYVDLASGEEIVENDREIAFREREGVVQTTKLTGEGPAEFWYVTMPNGDEEELGSLDVYPGSCTVDHTHVACSDSDGHLGVWRYREEEPRIRGRQWTGPGHTSCRVSRLPPRGRRAARASHRRGARSRWPRVRSWWQ